MGSQYHIFFDGLVQDCSNTMELLQSCTKPVICHQCLLHSGLKSLMLSDSGDYVIYRKFANFHEIYMDVNCRRVSFIRSVGQLNNNLM